MNFNKQDDKTASGHALPKRQRIAIAVLLAIGLGGGAAILASGPASSPKGHGEHAEDGHDDHGHDEAPGARPAAAKDEHGHAGAAAAPEAVAMTEAQVQAAAG